MKPPTAIAIVLSAFLSTSAAAATIAPADCSDPPVVLMTEVPIPPNVIPAVSAGGHEISYPIKFRRLGVSGSVIVEFDIDTTGAVRGSRIMMTSGNSQLDDYALEAVSTWRYRPALCNGQPIEEHTVQKIEWTLDKAP